MSSNVKAALIGLVAIALASVALLLFIRDRNTTAAVNKHLQTTANQVTPHLQQPGGRWAAAPSFKAMYRQFAAQEQAVLNRFQQRMPRRQFVQIALIPMHGLAPGLILTSRPGPRILVAPVYILLTAASRQARYVTVQQSGAQYQVLLKPLNVPQPLRRHRVSAVLEVLQA